jgi:hypothetical protein
MSAVTFNNEVKVVGDGHQPETTITGDKLDDYDQLLRLGQTQSAGQPISKASKALSAKLFGLEESGPTALGPALLVCIGMAAQSPGSEVLPTPTFPARTAAAAAAAAAPAFNMLNTCDFGSRTIHHTQIVVCTDGLSNVGLGQLDDLNTEARKSESESFYERIGYAPPE